MPHISKPGHAYRPLPNRLVRRPQQGFLLVQFAIAMTLLSLVLSYLGYQYWQKNVRGIADDRARLVGRTLASINDAAKSYMTTFFAQIQRGQAVTLGAYTVPAARVRNPSTADLYGLRMLESRFVQPLVYNGTSIGFSVVVTVDTSSGCVIPSCNLHSLTSSSSALLDPQSGQADVRRATLAAVTASPANAGVALPTNMGGDPRFFVNQNGLEVAANTSGVAGVIAAVNGYDSAGFMEFARRDGSLPMTGDINMLDDSGERHSIRNASDVATQTVTAAGRVKTGEFLDLDGPIQVEGTPCEKRGLAASDAGGLLLSCQSGRWKLAQGSGGKGMSGIWSNYRGMSASCFTRAGAYNGTYSATVSIDGELTLSVVDTQGRTGWLCKNVPFCGTPESYVSFNTYGVTGYYLASTNDEGGASTAFSCGQNFPAF